MEKEEKEHCTGNAKVNNNSMGRKALMSLIIETGVRMG